MTVMHLSFVSWSLSANRPQSQPAGVASQNEHRFLLFIGPMGQCIICWDWHIHCWNVCLSLHFTVCPSWSKWFFLSVRLSFFFFPFLFFCLFHRHIWMGFLEWGHAFSSHSSHSLFLFSLCLSSFYFLVWTLWEISLWGL